MARAPLWGRRPGTESTLQPSASSSSALRPGRGPASHRRPPARPSPRRPPGPRAGGAGDCSLHPAPGAPPVTSFFRFSLELPGLGIKQMIFLFHLDLGCTFVCSTLGSPVQTGREQAGAPPAQGKEGTGPGAVEQGGERSGRPSLPAPWPQSTAARPFQQSQRLPRAAGEQGRGQGPRGLSTPLRLPPRGACVSVAGASLRARRRLPSR